jgi:hypothetical protein
MRCSVNDAECVAGRLRAGMCEKHYRRVKTSGSTSSPRIDNLQHYAVEPSGCWRWIGSFWPNGYGKPSRPIHGTRLAHRMMYSEHVGPIPDGMDLDHLCRNRWCCNPQHLEPVTRAVNLARGRAVRTTCRNGTHDITLPGSVRPGTGCVACWRDRYRSAARRSAARKRALRERG